MNNRSGKSGFTLIEILVAVTIIVGILSMVYGSYFATSKSTQACKAKIALSQQARKVLEQMSRQIRCSYAPTAEKYTQSVRPISKRRKVIPKNEINYFNANPDEPSGEILHLVTTNGIPLGQSPTYGLFDVAYKLDMTRGLLLQSRQRFVGVSETLAQERNWQPVIRNVKCVELTFFDGQQWLPHWDFNNNRKLPCAVKINITSEDENYQQYHYGTIAYVCCRQGRGKKTPFETLVSVNKK